MQVISSENKAHALSLVNRTTEKFTINIISIIITIISIIITKVIPVNDVMILVMWIIRNEQTKKEGFDTSQYKNCKNQL